MFYFSRFTEAPRRTRTSAVPDTLGRRAGRSDPGPVAPILPLRPARAPRRHRNEGSGVSPAGVRLRSPGTREFRGRCAFGGGAPGLPPDRFVSRLARSSSVTPLLRA